MSEKKKARLVAWTNHWSLSLDGRSTTPLLKERSVVGLQCVCCVTPSLFRVPVDSHNQWFLLHWKCTVIYITVWEEGYAICRIEYIADCLSLIGYTNRNKYLHHFLTTSVSMYKIFPQPYPVSCFCIQKIHVSKQDILKERLVHVKINLTIPI